MPSFLSYSWDLYKDKTCHRFWSKNASKVCDDEEDVKGKIAIVTGGNSGIGSEIVMQLARRGAVVIMAVRDVQKGINVKVEIERHCPSCIVVVKWLDLADIQSIKHFVTEFVSKYPHLNILVNSAGVLYTSKELLKTKDGFELQVGVNHLGTFLLIYLLLESLYKGSPSRVVTLASTNLAIANLDFDDFMMENRLKRGDGGREQYNMSKLAIAVTVRKLVAILNENGITSSQISFFLMCPGLVKTELFRNERGCCRRCFTCFTIGVVGISPYQGSETACYLSLSKSLSTNENQGKGEMYRFMKVWQMGERILEGLDGSEQANKLYEMTINWLNLDPVPPLNFTNISPTVSKSKNISETSNRV